MHALTGVDRLQWLNVEMPVARNLRIDLLTAFDDGELAQIEFQSTNDNNRPLCRRRFRLR
jgi:hypothetical protein